MFSCPAVGSVSLVALVPGSNVMDVVDDGPVLVHLTVCSRHVRPARRWLRTRMRPEDDVMTLGTEYLMRSWNQIVDPIEVPIFAPMQAAS